MAIRALFLTAVLAFPWPLPAAARHVIEVKGLSAAARPSQKAVAKKSSTKAYRSQTPHFGLLTVMDNIEGILDEWHQHYDDLSFSMSMPMPTPHPAVAPTRAPQHVPVSAPTSRPTHSPGYPSPTAPSYVSGHPATLAPTRVPHYPTSASPTKTPRHPTGRAPTSAPTRTPTSVPGYPTPQAPTQAPTSVPGYPTGRAPTHAPTSVPGIPTGQAPTHAPTSVPGFPTDRTPTSAPRHAPTSVPGYPTEPAPTDSPSAPTATPVAGPVFTCTPTGIVDTGAPSFANGTIRLGFRVGYLLEAAAPTSEYLPSVERMIVAAAVAGAVQCATNGNGTMTNSIGTSIPIASVATDPCTPTTNGSACHVWETRFNVTIAGSTDPAVAAFLGYMSVQDAMENGAFTAAVPALDRILYLSPSPLLPPITGVDTGPSLAPGEATQTAPESLSVNRWTLGAVLTMCVGGVVALFAWGRNRRTRNERHLQLMEDVSLASPSRAGGAGRSDDV